MTPTVRRATAADAPVLARLRWQWSLDRRGERDAGLPGHAGHAGHAEEAAAFRRAFAEWVVAHLATHLPYVVEVSGRVCGSAWLVVASRVPSVASFQRPTGDVQSVFVVPELRDRGLGAALIGAILRDARELGLEFVTVHSSTRAVPFYLRNGFRDEHTWLEWRP